MPALDFEIDPTPQRQRFYQVSAAATASKQSTDFDAPGLISSTVMAVHSSLASRPSQAQDKLAGSDMKRSNSLPSGKRPAKSMVGHHAIMARSNNYGMSAAPAVTDHTFPPTSHRRHSFIPGLSMAAINSPSSRRPPLPFHSALLPGSLNQDSVSRPPVSMGSAMTAQAQQARFESRPLPPPPTLRAEIARFAATSPLPKVALPQTPKSAPRSGSRKRRQYPITPIETDLSSLAILATLPEETPGGRTSPSSSKSIQLRSGSVITVHSPADTAWQQRPVYIPGPIRVESHPWTKFHSQHSTPNLDSFIDSQDCSHTTSDAFGPRTGSAASSLNSWSRIRSDNAAVDEMVEFFEDFGIEPSKGDMDRFWLKAPKEEAPKANLAKTEEIQVKLDDPVSTFTADFSLPELTLPAGTPLVTDASHTESQKHRKSRQIGQPARMNLRRMMMSATSIM